MSYFIKKISYNNLGKNGQLKWFTFSKAACVYSVGLEGKKYSMKLKFRLIFCKDTPVI